MTERITARQFHESAGVEDWRALFSGACAHFRTGSFTTGVALVDAIARLADAADHHPDVDLRYKGVTVRLWTHDVDGLSERDIGLARQIPRRHAGWASRPHRPTSRTSRSPSTPRSALRSSPSGVPCWVIGRWATKTWSTPAAGGRRCGSSPWAHRALSATASTSTSACPTTRPKRASPPPSPPGAIWSAPSTHQRGGPGRRRGQRGRRGDVEGPRGFRPTSPKKCRDGGGADLIGGTAPSAQTMSEGRSTNLAEISPWRTPPCSAAARNAKY